MKSGAVGWSCNMLGMLGMLGLEISELLESVGIANSNRMDMVNS